MQNILICADGACSGNPGPGGWAYEIWDGQVGEGNEIGSGSGSSVATTNNIMELTAAIAAIEHVRDSGMAPGVITMYLDSEYVLNGMFTWRHDWKSRGWRTSSKKPVANGDQWIHLDAMIVEMEQSGWVFKSHWVRGHSGYEGNERVDLAAQKMRDIAKRDVMGGASVATNEAGAAALDQPVIPGDITRDKVELMRPILDGYASGDLSVKEVLARMSTIKDVLFG